MGDNRIGTDGSIDVADDEAVYIRAVRPGEVRDFLRLIRVATGLNIHRRARLRHRE